MNTGLNNKQTLKMVALAGVSADELEQTYINDDLGLGNGIR